MLVRSDDMLGLREISLETCRIIENFDKMHTKPILEFELLSDQKTLVTAGRDRKICIWNFSRKLLLEDEGGPRFRRDLPGGLQRRAVPVLWE